MLHFVEESDVALEVTCPTCRGEGEIVGPANNLVECPDCAVTGLVPSTYGRAILLLVRRWSGTIL